MPRTQGPRAERGRGDYAEMRHQMLGSLSVDELLERMSAGKPKARRAGGKKKRTARRAIRRRR